MCECKLARTGETKDEVMEVKILTDVYMDALCTF